ncbi:VanZ family protein [Pseudomonas sp. GV071]|uniref:VanZ family protein n=1 Tax=Pseudomonas sp. GV071 TaxID=2135754 RepID=UPI000D3537D6|nr:VanZ family protein [Pseudomonas sp. GV071]PTQ70665.1 VanZ family protein [Pseudomonas sp. GV071]
MGRIVLVVLFLAVLASVLLGGLSPKPLPQVFAYQDWLYHAAAFAALVFFARVAFPRTLTFWTVLYCLLLALLIEFVHGLMPARTASVGDMFANVVGVLLGMGLALLWKRRLLLREAAGDY